MTSVHNAESLFFSTLYAADEEDSENQGIGRHVF